MTDNFIEYGSIDVHILFVKCQYIILVVSSEYIYKCSFLALMDTIQLVQSLRSFLPPPHIQVSSWKNEDKHRYEET